MSSLDLSDPNILIAHDALLRNGATRWCLLEYGHGPHVLVLSASGTGDVDEFRAHLKDNVCFGVFREQTQDKSLRISINYIPNSVRGVWRARALVHVTAVASKFQVHEVLTVSSPDQVSVRALRSTLNLPPRDAQFFLSAPLSNLLGSDESPNINPIPRKLPADTHSISVLSSLPQTHSPSPTNESHLHSSYLASSLSTNGQNALKVIDLPSPTSRDGPLPPIAPVSRKSSLLENISTASSSNFSKKTSQQSPLVTSPVPISTNESRIPHTPLSPQNASWLAKQESPLPPPPHSKTEDQLQDAERRSLDSDGQPVSSQIGSIPDSNSVASLNILDSTPSPAPPVGGDARHITEAPNRPIDGLPPSSLSSPPTSQHMASQPVASEDITGHVVTNRSTVEDSGKFSAPTRPRSRFQERASSPANTDEERKLVVLEEERRRRATERARREKEIREEEEAREREFEERKERERRRRLENARKSEERRIEHKRQQEEEEARKKAERERKEIEVRERRSRIKQRFEKQAGMNLLSGFITLESSSSWKRRYYRLSIEDWNFFKNDEDTTIPIHVLELSRIRALREWHEGYEELEAIPNSFAVEFKDDAPCLFFADSAEDKEILLGLLNQAAGL